MSQYIDFKKIQKFIYLGSGDQYGKCNSPVKEDDTYNSRPLTTYSLSKSLAENYLDFLHLKYGLQYISLRLFLIYGPKQKKDRLIPYVISTLFKNEKASVTAGSQIRDFLYIDDLNELLIKIVKSKNNFSGVLNVGSGKPVTVNKVINLIKNYINLGKISVDRQKKMKKNELLKLYPNISLVKKIYNWRPNTELSEGIKLTVNFYKNE